MTQGRPLLGSLWAFALLVAIPCSTAGRVLAQTPSLQAEQSKNLGVAYLEENHPAEAERVFRRVIELASDEVLGYANLGVSQLRLGEPEAAASQLEQARRLDPTNVAVLLLGAEVQYAAGRWDAVISTARKVLELDPGNAVACYYIYRAAVAQPDSEPAQQLASQQIEALFRSRPDNLVIALRYARLQAEQNAWKTVAKALELIEPATRENDKASELFRAARAALTDSVDADKVRYLLAALENVLRPTSRFRQDLMQLQPPVAGLPLTRFSDKFYAALENERPHAVPVQFQYVADKSVPSSRAVGSDVTRGSIDFGDLDGDGRDEWLVSFVAGVQGAVQLWQNQQGEWRNVLAHSQVPAARQARLVDLDDDGQFEIVAVGPTGTVLLQPQDDANWKDVVATRAAKSLAGSAVELIDADNEGDLDLCVAGTDQFVLWQNRADRTLLDISSSSGLAAAGGGIEQVVATDCDDDLDTDLIVIGADGQLQLWENRRHGKFARRACGLSKDACRCVLPRDWDNDGFEDLVAMSRQGDVSLQRNRAGTFAPAVTLPLQDVVATAVTELDYDNDGWLDLAIAGCRAGQAALIVLRNQGDGTWVPMVLPSPAGRCVALGAVDYDRDGDLDLVALGQHGRLHTWRNEGGNANHWLRVQLKGLQIAGSKNNLHGVGSKLEIKAGLCYQMQMARRTETHFGLGARPQADLLRVVWSNGVPQNHFRPLANQTIREVQVLKGSCPYLYCWNGTEFVFVTDTLAGAPLGLQVAEGVVAPDNPRELLTIARDKIGRQGNSYVFQYTSELWETVYLDQVALWAVDHPSGSDVFTDQRFLPPPYDDPEPIVTQQRVPPKLVEDTNGRNVTAQLAEFDHQYPEQLRPTRYQGIVEPHCLTMQFGDVSELARPVLVIGCWIFWTDTSINVAVSQDSTRTPHPTVLEIWDRESGWHAMDEPFGLPTGKDKWVVVDVAQHLDREDARIRIRSESEIHWDQVFLADRGGKVPRTLTKLSPANADLHFGGFNQLYRPTADGPHLYRYGWKTESPVWMDMTGLATRFGEVTELLSAVDDRFAIFTGGDEVTIRFDAAALPPLPSGWRRDFLFYSDGWEKDSDRNTVSGETVEPLPFHGMSAYPYGAQESYPQDELHHAYQRRYNTRRIGPEAFRRFVKDYHDTAPPQLPWDQEPGVRGDHTR